MKEILIDGDTYRYLIGYIYGDDIHSSPIFGTKFFYGYEEYTKRYGFLWLKTRTSSRPKYAFKVYYDIESYEFKHMKGWSHVLREAKSKYELESNNDPYPDDRIKY